MRAQQRECPVIGGPSVSAQESERDTKFDSFWLEYEPKVRRMASSYCIDGAVGAELDDLMQIAQQVLLHSLRRYDPAKAKARAEEQGRVWREAEFPTYFYTCLRNEYVHLQKRCFPRRQYMITAYDSAKCDALMEQGVTEKDALRESDVRLIKCAGHDIENTLAALRAAGLTYMITHRTPKTRYPLLDNISALDAPAKRGPHDDQEFTLAEVIAAPDEPMTVEEIIERIEHRIPDLRLREIAMMLFKGYKMAGPDGIMKLVGLKKHQAERDLQRIRMLLAGEFGVKLEIGGVS